MNKEKNKASDFSLKKTLLLNKFNFKNKFNFNSRPFFIILNRELKSVFASSFYYVLASLFIAALGVLFFFMNGFLAKNVSSLDELFFALSTVSYIAIPILVFTSWEKEKTTGTLELLFSFPVSESSIILAKIFSIFIQYFSLIILTFVFPLVISPYAVLSGRIIFCQYFIHLCYSFFAISLSSLFFVTVKSSVLAACLSFLFLFLFGYINYIPVLMSVPNFVEKIISFVSIKFRIVAANRGVLDSRDIAFFICNGILFFFLQERFFFLRRWSK